MKNILVPIDFSKASLNAANYAVSFAYVEEGIQESYGCFSDGSSSSQIF